MLRRAVCISMLFLGTIILRTWTEFEMSAIHLDYS